MTLRTIRAMLASSIAGLAAVALVLSGCTSSAAFTPVEDGTLNWAISGDNLSEGHMDPHASQLDVSAYVNRQTLDSLVYLNAKGEIVPWLAKSWLVSADGKTYTFTLRDDVTFTDGTPFNAQAVKENFDHIMAESTESAAAASMLGGELYVATETVSDHEVVVRFAEPFAPFLANASTAFLGMYSPATLAENAERLKTGGPGITVGSGPFILTEFVANDVLRYERNADYAWAPEGLKLSNSGIQKLNIELVADDSVRFNSVVSGELDLASGVAPSVLTGSDAKVAVNNAASPGLPYSLLLNEKHGVFAEQQVRQAFAQAIDISSAVENVFFGQRDRAFSILSPSTPNAYDESLEQRETFNRKGAISLLESAGWTELNADGYRVRDGEELAATWYTWTPVSEETKSLASVFIEDLKSVGFKLEHRVVEPAEYMEVYSTGAFDIADWDYASADADILRSHLHTDGYQNASQVSNPEIDALLEQAAASTDPAQRKELYGQVQQWNAEYTAIVPIYLTSFTNVSNSTLVRGIEYDGFGWPVLMSAESSHTS